MKNDMNYGILLRIIEHYDRIEETKNRINGDFDTYVNDFVIQDAINMNIFQIGELANQLSEPFRESTNDIPWHKMYGIRNIIGHAYVIVDKKTSIISVGNYSCGHALVQ